MPFLHNYATTRVTAKYTLMVVKPFKSFTIKV